MRILVHDRSGHPFQVQLSRWFARRGHETLHSYAEFFQSPKGDLINGSGDSSKLRIEGLQIKAQFKKYSFVRRRFQEMEYGRQLLWQIKCFSPDILVLSNTPPDVHNLLFRKLRTTEIKTITWVQDLYGIAINKILKQKHAIIGAIAGIYYKNLECKLLRKSDGIVLITDDFVEIMTSWGIQKERMKVIPNWAPIDELQITSKENAWSKDTGLEQKFCFLYSGTLGMKHNPNILLALALHFRNRPEVAVVIVSEGLGADWLKAKKRDLDLINLHVYDYQPFKRMPEVLGSGDVLMAILEPDAGIYSVPSKILTYLCAQRPLLAGIPRENLGARIVLQSGAGIVADPSSIGSFLQAAECLYRDPALRASMAKSAVAYATEKFDIEKIGLQFEDLLEQCMTRRSN
jgi:colanic acid biosynthesis glycosyl transferase WcaI